MSGRETSWIEQVRGEWPKEAPVNYRAVDPGVTTGVAEWSPNGGDVQFYELGVPEFRQHLATWRGWSPAQTHTFSERFDIGQKTVDVAPPIDSLYLNGWMLLVLGAERYTEVSRAAGKSITNAQLRHAGLWVKGSGDHCRDAARILYVSMLRFQEPQALEWARAYADREGS